MIDDLPIVTFDTSAHNRLVKDRSRSEAVLAVIKSDWFFRFAALSIEELVSTPDLSLRAAFFASCAELQKGPNDCLYPQNELIRLLVVAHFRNPATFDWRTVDVSAPEYEDAIRSQKFVGDQQLTSEQSREMQTRKTDYKEMSCKPREHIREIFEKHKETPPITFREAITRLQGADSPLIWNMGKWLYDRGAETDASEVAVKQFMNICPPFRALVYAMLMSWYNFGVRDPKTGQRFNAGANDQYMSIYLPYCDTFVTADEEQQKCLREIAHSAGMKTEVLSYDDFCTSLLTTA
jgi:hypothetical protein